MIIYCFCHYFPQVDVVYIADTIFLFSCVWFIGAACIGSPSSLCWGGGDTPEVRELVKDHEEKYNLDLHRSRLGFVKGLAQHIKDESGGIEDLSFGFVLGTRKGDPNCGVQHSFSPSR